MTVLIKEKSIYEGKKGREKNRKKMQGSFQKKKLKKKLKKKHICRGLFVVMHAYRGLFEFFFKEDGVSSKKKIPLGNAQNKGFKGKSPFFKLFLQSLWYYQ